MKKLIFVVFAGVLMTTNAMSATRAQGPRAAEGNCTMLSETYGADRLWWGRFSGGRERPPWDRIEYRTTETCFTAKAACDAWLYELKSEFGLIPRWNECRRGYQPGATVKPWWTPKR
jgi:hypothetical protein